METHWLVREGRVDVVVSWRVGLIAEVCGGVEGGKVGGRLVWLRLEGETLEGGAKHGSMYGRKLSGFDARWQG